MAGQGRTWLKPEQSAPQFLGLDHCTVLPFLEAINAGGMSSLTLLNLALRLLAIFSVEG